MQMIWQTPNQSITYYFWMEAPTFKMQHTNLTLSMSNATTLILCFLLNY